MSIAALACIATYIVQVGAGPCVVRAALMGELITLAIVALVSVSAGDQQWCLGSETLQGYTLLRTNRRGIELTTDSQQM